jgi:hypothetical protein
MSIDIWYLATLARAGGEHYGFAFNAEAGGELIAEHVTRNKDFKETPVHAPKLARHSCSACMSMRICDMVIKWPIGV